MAEDVCVSGSRKHRKEDAGLMKTKLTVDHGYLIGQFGDVKALVDTGSPASFGTRSEVVVDGVTHRIARGGLGRSFQEILALSGADFDILLGTDVLAQHPFTLDTRQGEISFGGLPREGHVERVDILLGTPFLNVEVGNQTVPCFLDTGATIAFLGRETPWPVPPSGERRDLDPMFGPFVTPVGRCPARLLGHDFNLDFSELPEEFGALLSLTGIGGSWAWSC
jgi:hypothetical protein